MVHCLHTRVTVNICMKKFSWKNIIDILEVLNTPVCFNSQGILLSIICGNAETIKPWFWIGQGAGNTFMCCTYYCIYSLWSSLISCMLHLCTLHLQGTKPKMPSWMEKLHDKMISSSTHYNVKLFIAKLIGNTAEVCTVNGLKFWKLFSFCFYTKFWLPGLVFTNCSSE